MDIAEWNPGVYFIKTYAGVRNSRMADRRKSWHLTHVILLRPDTKHNLVD